MADDIKAGDTVQLKSGGPKMTVAGTREWNGVMEAHCDWFDGTTKKEADFPLTSLKRLD